MLLFSTSCEKNNEEQNLSDIPENIFNLEKTLIIPLDSVGRHSVYYTMVNTEEKNLLGLVNFNLNAIELHDLKNLSEKPYKRIILKKEGDEAVGVLTGFDWHNDDSIFTISNVRSGNKMAMVDSEGNYKRTVVARNLSEEYDIYSMSGSSIHFINGYLYNPGVPSFRDLDNPANNAKQKIDIEDIVKVSDGSKVQMPTGLPKSVGKGSMMFGRVKGKGKQMVYSFYQDHSLYTLDLDFNNENGLVPHLAKSKFAKEIQTNNQDPSDPMTYFKWLFNNVTYEDVYYNSYLHVYYRIVGQPTGYTHDPVSGKQLDGNQRPFSVIVLDEQFNIIGEQLFPAEKYEFTYGRAFIHPKGLYLGLNNPHNTEIGEDEMAFQLLELKAEFVKQAKKNKL
ncbi:MAG: hypothetical protein ACJAWV_004431 [Flammeovirgaceae bacterium]|jgi:hypothetical protein